MSSEDRKQIDRLLGEVSQNFPEAEDMKLVSAILQLVGIAMNDLNRIADSLAPQPKTGIMIDKEIK